ncbi:unannotated protein [freshwater metagenome]|uniref:Unannotated protein n=1 Tax=freshwater metagenome TaxID=449393 RepID=A0A6J6DDG6_9ZZZZ|nr:LysM peptidoglycan-binding domain-containing protein [Actinomycetota bacterium]
MPEAEHSPRSADARVDSLEHAVLSGLTPRTHRFEGPSLKGTGGIRKTLFGSLPFLMTGTLAAGVGVAPAGPTSTEMTALQPGHARDDTRPGLAQRLSHAMLPIAHSIIAALRPDLPATYTVQAGDTVSSIAEAFELPTPAILTLNGLSWNSLVHEGQILKLSPEPTKKRAGSPARLAAGGYVVSPGDTVTTIAGRLGISAQALTAHNGLQPDSTIYAGQMLSVPGATRPTVERTAPTAMPVIASTPTVLSASTRNDGETDESAQADTSSGVPFDAADLPLAEAPALIVVQVPKKPAVVATKAPAANPAPVAQASAPAPAPEATASGEVGQPVAGSITPLNDERRANAQAIISVGRELGVPDYGIVIALATAMQESSLRNINWGDRDSVGLYQQRPSSGWGSVEQIMDAGYATRLFFGGPQNPNKGKTRGLLDITNWQSMTLTEAAQRVQISAFPKAYAKWEPSAWAWLYELT